jgi:hypothetical protein
MEFQAGNFTLGDGTEDHVLKSISSQVMEGKVPSNAQINMFRGRAGHYAGLSVEGKERVTPESTQCRGKNLDDLKVRMRSITSLVNKKEIGLIESVMGQADRKEFVSEKQEKMLNNLYEKYERKL